MKLYNGSHGAHVIAYRKNIEDVVQNATGEFSRTMALRVDVHYPPILDRGDTVCCFPNLEPGVISRFRNSLNAILDANEKMRATEGKRIYRNRTRHVWVREFSEEGKCHFHLGLFFNKDAYYHLGDYETESNLRMMIIRAWYSALDLELDDYAGLVHFPKNCRYILDVNDFNFEDEYKKLLNRLDYLAKLDTKLYGDGDRNFGCSRG
ncbi:inovirus Gp2 family protein [Escherichia coli]|nr:inovirus Gp2 family protein [Escherichia coli]ELV7627643.1 inovirus Gp2 family protein [Escherichia coli]ELW1605582.1 inovirus Gp2 family protein [Escherichia coli]